MDTTDSNALRARQGRPDAFAVLYARVAPSLAAWVRMRTGGGVRHLVDPDDLGQEIWWTALEAFDRFDPERGTFRSWIFGIAANCYRRSLRSGSASPPGSPPRPSRPGELPSELEASLTSITENARRREDVVRLVAVVDALDAEERRLFIHCGLEGMTCREFSTVLGISDNATVKRWRKLRERLARHPLILDLIDEA